MAGRLKDLLLKNTLARTVQDYEGVYDDFVRCSDGWRVTDRFNVPSNYDNADYYFELDGYDLVMELKQIHKYLKDRTVDSYFNNLLSRGELRGALADAQPGTTIHISPEGLSFKQWRRFYETFRPNVLQALKKANSQLADSDLFIPHTRARRVRAAVLVNTNDYSLSTDLLFRIVERKVKLEWRAGHYRSLDMVICCSIDMHRTGRNALHARRIVRSKDDSVLVDAAWFIHDRWARYVASELGLQIEYVSDDGEQASQPDKIEVQPAFDGKLQLVAE